MKLKESEARKILGLKDDENPRLSIEAFQKTLLRKQGFVDNSPSPESKKRYQNDLDRYQMALDWVQATYPPKPPRDWGRIFVIVVLVVSVITAGVWWKYDQSRQVELRIKKEKKEAIKRDQQIAKLETDGKVALVKRKWKTAEIIYKQILTLDPDSVIGKTGMLGIQKGKREERNQKIHYLLGNSQAALEAGQWDEATRLVQSVLNDDPNHSKALKMMSRIEKQRRDQEILLKIRMVEKALELENLPVAQSALLTIKKMAPLHPDIPELTNKLNLAIAALKVKRSKALALYEKARELDKGEFSAPALQFINEAMSLDPRNQDIIALNEKMSAYIRTIQVPGDFPTITEALAKARPRDRVQVAAGVYKESLKLNKNIRLEGSPDGKTIVEYSAKDAALLTIAPTVKGAIVSGLTFRHLGTDLTDNRSSGVIIQGSEVTLQNCHVVNAAGHGIAVIDGAFATISGCQITSSGWDGISVYGEGSRAEIRNTTSQKNLQQGIGFWKGGAGKVRESKCLANGLCGILAMSPGTQVNIQTTLSARNRGAGILVSDQVNAQILANRCDKNLLSGIVARGAGTTVVINKCVTTGNGEVGILVSRDVKRDGFIGNVSKGNKKRQIWLDAMMK